MGVLNAPNLTSLLDALHAKSTAQEAETNEYWRTRTGPWNGMEDRDHAFLADKLVALERDKSEFCYLTCRAIGARRVLELGTSFGVSTLYLAQAVKDNGGGVVIGAEYEPAKVAAARANFAAAGLEDMIDLHEGDVMAFLPERLTRLDGPIDFVLFDIWGDVVRPILDMVRPHLRPGSVICADNTAGPRGRQGYATYFEVVDDPANGFATQTLPFQGGFEMTVKVA